MTERQVVEAKEPFSVTLRTGVPLSVSQGDRYWSDDPLVKGRENLFTPLVIRTSVPTPPTTQSTETATAAPGERRVTPPPPRDNKPAVEKRG